MVPAIIQVVLACCPGGEFQTHVGDNTTQHGDYQTDKGYPIERRNRSPEATAGTHPGIP